MRLSDDGTTLLSVTNADIHEGRFIIPDTVTRIGDGAFRGSTGLTAVRIPEGVAIGDYAFYGCTGLTAVSIAEGVAIGNYAFYGCTDLKAVSIPEGVAIGNCAFARCTSLRALSISEGVAVGRCAFARCTGLTAVSIPEGVAIGNCAFDGCTGLTALGVHEGIAIGRYAFSRCTGLINILVNSDNAEELERIKGLFPEHPQARFINKQTIARVSNLQERAYQRIINAPAVSILYGIHERMRLPHDVLPIIGFYEGVSNPARQLFNIAVNALPPPLNDAEFAKYEEALNAISNQMKERRIAEQAVQQKMTDCIAKLKGYVSCLQKLMAEKNARHPIFFDTNKELRSDLQFKISAVAKVIAYFS